MHSSCICSLKPATINCKLLMTTLSSAAHLCNLPLALLTCLVYPYPPHQTEQFMIFQLGKNSPKDLAFHGIGRGMSQNWDKHYKGVVCTYRHTREQTYWHKDLKLTLRRKDNWLSLLQLDFMSTSDCAKIVCSFDKSLRFFFWSFIWKFCCRSRNLRYVRGWSDIFHFGIFFLISINSESN